MMWFSTIIRNIYYWFKFFDKRFVNTIKLFELKKDSYIFLQMAVKWKGLSLIKYNFGDDLNVYLLEELTGKRILKYDEFFHLSSKNYLGIGSCIEYCSNSNSIIWGSGAMMGNKMRKVKAKRVLLVRGPLTKDYLESFGIKCPDCFGDPALLLPLVYNPTISKRYSLGVVPHFVDYNLPHVRRFREEHPEIHFIDLQNYNNWQNVINEFLMCENIVSSSLHGLIISDAYKIPNVRIKFSNLILGGDFKFEDYFRGIGRTNSNCLDFCHEINMNAVDSALSLYKLPRYDIGPLLSTFPFELSDKYKHLIN